MLQWIILTPEDLESTCTTGHSRRPWIQITADLENNDELHIYSWVCPLINWQNTKGNKRRKKKIWKLRNLRKNLLIKWCIKFTRKEWITFYSVHRPIFSTSTLARLIIFHQLKKQLSSNLLHMLMSQLRDGIGNWSCPPNGAGRRYT